MCDSMIVGKAATVCDYTIFGKNSDRSPNEPQSMILIPMPSPTPGRQATGWKSPSTGAVLTPTGSL